MSGRLGSGGINAGVFLTMGDSPAHFGDLGFEGSLENLGQNVGIRSDWGAKIAKKWVILQRNCRCKESHPY